MARGESTPKEKKNNNNNKRRTKNARQQQRWRHKDNELDASPDRSPIGVNKEAREGERTGWK